MASIQILSENKIFIIRGKRVMLDLDLAQFYGITVKRIREQIRRNIIRFPEDFMIQLTKSEHIELAANCGEFNTIKFSRTRAFVFTEHGVIMAATVLNSVKAVSASILIVRTFVRLREMISTDKNLVKKLNQLEKKLENHDESIKMLVMAIRELSTPVLPQKRKKISLN